MRSSYWWAPTNEQYAPDSGRKLIVRLGRTMGGVCSEVLDSDGGSYCMKAPNKGQRDYRRQAKGTDGLLFRISRTNSTTEPGELRKILCTPGFLTLLKTDSPSQIDILRHLFCE
jgi:hypothetical protein